MWGSIVGFGESHYRDDSGREGDSAAAGLAARKAAMSVYAADGVGAHADLLERLGLHTTAVPCVDSKDLDAVDLEVLETIVAPSYSTLATGTYRKRTRDGGKS